MDAGRGCERGTAVFQGTCQHGRYRRSHKDGGRQFSIGCLSDGTRLQPVVDPTVVFSYDTSLQKPIGFEGTAVKELLVKEQITMNQLPCSFYGTEAELAADESICFYEIIGQVENKDLLKAYAAKNWTRLIFMQKQKRQRNW